MFTVDLKKVHTQKPHWRPLFRALQRSAFGEERQTKKVLGFSPIKCDELPTHYETLENRPPRDRIASSLEFKMFIFWSGRPSPKALHWAFQVFDIEMFSLILFGMNEQSLFQTIFALFLLTNCLHLLCLTFSFWRKSWRNVKKGRLYSNFSSFSFFVIVGSLPSFLSWVCSAEKNPLLCILPIFYVMAVPSPLSAIHKNPEGRTNSLCLRGLQDCINIAILGTFFLIKEMKAFLILHTYVM